jgi:Flp pilus assembly protein TadG
MRSETVCSLKRRTNQRGAALLEVALTLPIMLLVSVGIFEFGRAYQHWQVITNAAREGARMASLPNADPDNVRARVQQYLQNGALSGYASASVAVDPAEVSNGVGTVSASRVTVAYPFNFIVLNPVARLVSSSSTVGAPITLTAAVEMRNESAF